MEKIELKKIELALTIGALRRHRKRLETSLLNFEEKIKDSKNCKDKTEHQKHRISRNKRYKLKVVEDLLIKLEPLLSKDEYLLTLSEMDYDYSDLQYTKKF